jgi:hypothetical protein
MRSTLLAAFAMASIHCVSIQFGGAGKPRPIIKPQIITGYHYVGCFANKFPNAIKNSHGVVNTVDKCKQLAESNNDDLFAVGNGYTCKSDKFEVSDFDKLGRG